MRKRKWMFPRRRFLASVAGLAVVAPLPGCATVFRPPVAANPLTVPSNDFEAVWMACVTTVDDYFDLASENRLQRKIITEPRIGATVFEPWQGDSVGFHERLESTLQTIRRYAIVTINTTATGTYAIDVEVRKELEDMTRPERQSAGRAVFDNQFPVNRAREIVGPVPLPNGWIPRGRDNKLEQVILAKIKDKLLL